jgi:peptidoglycan/xylan/chitin deacetylase (PgdA/CDA1 family)
MYETSFLFFCRMYLVKTNWWIRKLFPTEVTWKIRTDKKEVFITFDDGPHPTITPFVLACLKQHDAKATFFCIGKNVKASSRIYQQILAEGHSVGNHTYDHLNGWKSGDIVYFKNVILAGQLIDTDLFRPPYGRITKSQVKELVPDYKIIMWDVLSGDFDLNLSAQQCFDNVANNVGAGSVIVFHDSEKAFPRLEHALPRVLKYLSDQGYQMNRIPSATITG